jgi:dihydroorotate dehydrogenase/Pyruvate/2-oxoacid:ferredoxin oxidoreductase delta subunit
MSDLSVTFAGLALKNPLVASAGPITAGVEAVKRLVDAGIGAVVTKTGFTRPEYERWVGRKDIFPYRPVYKYQGLEKGRLLSLPTLSDVPVAEAAKRVEGMKRLGVPVIGSIMGLSPAGYRESARMLVDAGADAVELDLCCTIPEFTTTYRWAGQNVNFYPKKYAELVKVVKDRVSVPVGVKSTVSLFLYGKILEGLIRSKLQNRPPEFITVVGQIDQNPGIDMETLAPLVPHVPTFGWQGTLSCLTYSALATFASTLGTTHPFLSASGGMRNHEDVVTALAFGATAVQLQTAVLDKGPGVVTKILRGLEAYLDGRGIGSVDRIVGAASEGYIPAIALGGFMRERDTLFGRVFAAVSEGLCTGCGICREVCTEGAVTIEGKKARIERDRCRGCNLCVLKCPAGAIGLQNLDLLFRLMEKYKDHPGARSFREFMGRERVGFFGRVLFKKRLREWGLF